MNSWQLYDEYSLPTGPGIYCFRLKLVTLESVGLIGNSRYTQSEVDTAKRKLISRFSLLSNVYGSRKLVGSLQEPYKKENTPLRLDVSADISDLFNMESYIDLVKRCNDIPHLIKLLSTANSIMPLLYVGIAYDQTLYQRYHQHKNNYMNKKEGCFGARVSAAGLRWSDLQFAAVECGVTCDHESISLYEDMLHGLYKPVFSYK